MQFGSASFALAALVFDLALIMNCDSLLLAKLYSRNGKISTKLQFVKLSGYQIIEVNALNLNSSTRTSLLIQNPY